METLLTMVSVVLGFCFCFDQIDEVVRLMGWGAQIGGDFTDYCLVLNTQRSVEAFSGAGQVSLGAGLGVSAGPVGRNAGGSININDGVGSTHLSPLKAAVVAHGADLGIAHDGDADRCLAVDHEGTEVDGDQIMAILATRLSLHRSGPPDLLSGLSRS